MTRIKPLESIYPYIPRFVWSVFACLPACLPTCLSQLHLALTQEMSDFDADPISAAIEHIAQLNRFGNIFSRPTVSLSFGVNAVLPQSASEGAPEGAPVIGPFVRNSSMQDAARIAREAIATQPTVAQARLEYRVSASVVETNEQGSTDVCTGDACQAKNWREAKRKACKTLKEYLTGKLQEVKTLHEMKNQQDGEARRKNCNHNGENGYIATVLTTMGPAHITYEESAGVRLFLAAVLKRANHERRQSPIVVGMDSEGHESSLPPRYIQLCAHLTDEESIPRTVVFELKDELKSDLATLFQHKFVKLAVFGKKTEQGQMDKFNILPWDGVKMEDVQQDANISLADTVGNVMGLTVKKWLHYPPDFDKSVWAAFAGAPPLTSLLVLYAGADAHATHWLYHHQELRRAEAKREGNDGPEKEESSSIDEGHRSTKGSGDSATKGSGAAAGAGAGAANEETNDAANDDAGAVAGAGGGAKSNHDQETAKPPEAFGGREWRQDLVVCKSCGNTDATWCCDCPCPTYPRPHDSRLNHDEAKTAVASPSPTTARAEPPGAKRAPPFHASNRCDASGEELKKRLCQRK